MPENYIVYQGKKYNSLILKINASFPFREIYERIDTLSFPLSSLKDEYLRYALLELLGNSIQVHRKKGIEEEIKLALHHKGERLHIAIIDHGGGFDAAAIPNRMNSGMGFKLARKLFPVFAINFYDKNGAYIPYTPEGTIGTCIQIIVA